MRSATSSAYPRTAMTCGSIIWCTPMKLGPTTFQCTCFSVRCRSLYVLSCFCRSLATSLPWRALRPGMVNCGITNSFGCTGYLRARIPRVSGRQSTTRGTPPESRGICGGSTGDGVLGKRPHIVAESAAGATVTSVGGDHGVAGVPRQGCPGFN